MGHIYNNFQELINESHELFSVLQKNGISGVVKAVWYARQHEVDLITIEKNILNKKCSKLSIGIEEIEGEKDFIQKRVNEIQDSLDLQKRDSVTTILKLKESISDIEKLYLFGIGSFQI